MLLKLYIMKQIHTLVASSDLSPQGHHGMAFLRGQTRAARIIAEFLVQNQQEWQESALGNETLWPRVGGGAEWRMWGGFPVCNVAPEIAIEDRTEKCFAADISLCVILRCNSPEAKRRDKKRTVICELSSWSSCTNTY